MQSLQLLITTYILPSYSFSFLWLVYNSIWSKAMFPVDSWESKWENADTYIACMQQSYTHWWNLINLMCLITSVTYITFLNDINDGIVRELSLEEVHPTVFWVLKPCKLHWQATTQSFYPKIFQTLRVLELNA